MSAPGPSKQKNQYYKRGGAGGGDRGRGGGGGRGRGRGKPPAPGGSGGASYVGEDGKLINPLSRYRESIAIGGMTAPGISVTTVQFKERSAEREVIEYLETLADEMEESDPSASAPSGDMEDDLDAQLKQELEGLSGATKVKSTRFRLCQHDTPCVIYINVLPPLDPIQMVMRIMEKVESTGQSPFNRLVPISAVGNATLKQVADTARPLIAAGFATPDNRPLKFAIQPHARNSNKLDRLELIKKIADEVIALPEGHKVDLTNADRTILIEVDKNSFGISVVSNYDRFKKLNPSQIAETLAKARAAEAPSAEEANRVARAAAINTAPVNEVAVGSGGEKRKAEDQGEGDEDVEMEDASGAEGKANKIQRME